LEEGYGLVLLLLSQICRLLPQRFAPDWLRTRPQCRDLGRHAPAFL